MKQSVFEEVGLRLKIMKVNAAFSFRESIAYSANNWGGLASTVVYMITYLVFLGAIFGRVKTVAGYNYSEILLFTLVSQFNFYLAWIWSIKNIETLGESVKSGFFDLILTKPLPTLWYVTFLKINLTMLLIEMWPATLPLIYLLVKNAEFVISLPGLLWGSVIFICGHIAIHCMQFVFGLGAFWAGEYKAMNSLSYQIAFFGDSVPIEAYPKWFLTLGVSIFPFLLHTALTTSFILGKTTDLRWVLWSVLVMVVFLIIKKKMWEKALRAYSSASS
ncbi:hypothetical protein A2572_01740 [Candidatus Collierbacteria bacterium RIFOXYD1_FULL_40_9]|uniref:Uncharacterized protein n=1 Tax=Candidatus Collierbacteria bacterium RIFOXYD1_FULL_40_9 TaxID=1817731 RepID=A0A1F5FUE6_9BACT|nr:MAG: hypothetical protein A2572_01740 [Candidatus Collierbacteria bacterium RIFOXYD1_FULL_40_9]